MVTGMNILSSVAVALAAAGLAIAPAFARSGESSVSFRADSEASFDDTRNYDNDFPLVERNKLGLRPRAGVVLDNSFFYATGGGAWARDKRRLITANGINAFGATGRSQIWGKRYGGGVEHRLAPNISIGAQYLYANMRNRDDDVRAAVFGASERGHSHSAMATMSLRF